MVGATSSEGFLVSQTDVCKAVCIYRSSISTARDLNASVMYLEGHLVTPAPPFEKFFFKILSEKIDKFLFRSDVQWTDVSEPRRNRRSPLEAR